MNRRCCSILLPLLLLVACARTNYIYRSPNRIDFIKLSSADRTEREGGLKHPYSFPVDQLRSMISSLRFNKRLLFRKEAREGELLEERHVETLLPHLIEAFRRATPEQVVVVSFFTQSSRFLVPDDRLTIFRAFLKEDGLHLRFTKLYAKMTGDRTTKGPERAIAEARGLRVGIELQPGQRRISWDPHEIAIDLGADKVKEPAEPKVRAPVQVPEASKGVRERLRELDRLREEELITEKEYQKKRRELIQQL